MGRITRLLFAFVACSCLGVTAFANDTGANAGAIIAGSSHMCDIIKSLRGEDSFDVRTLVPPTMCPGHFDIKPSELAALKQARCILLHNYQVAMPVIQSILNAGEIPRGRVRVLDIPGNWLVPAVQEQAVKRIAAILSEIEPDRAPDFKANAAHRIERVRRAGAEALERLRQPDRKNPAVVCHDKLSGFLKWAGFNVVGEYGADGQLSASRMRTLIDGARAAGVSLVVDNIQGGGLRTGAALARDIGAAHVVLSNFPGGFSDAENWADTLRKNVEILQRTAERFSRK